jgi:hypothetical protein
MTSNLECGDSSPLSVGATCRVPESAVVPAHSREVFLKDGDHSGYEENRGTFPEVSWLWSSPGLPSSRPPGCALRRIAPDKARSCLRSPGVFLS